MDAGSDAFRCGTSHARDPELAAQELFEAIYHPRAVLSLFFCSPRHPRGPLAAALRRRWQDSPLIGVTTAGEITPTGYQQGSLTGVSLLAPTFEAYSCRLDGVRGVGLEDCRQLAQALLARASGQGGRKHAFGLLLSDGLCLREELLAASLHECLDGVPLIGGSAGDGVEFASTAVYHQGEFRRDCAAFVLIRSASPVATFKSEHFAPSDARIVITRACPSQRLVSEINGAGAAREYARLVGVDPGKLTPLSLSEHPLVLRVGGQSYVRSVQQVMPDGSLRFFCALDEGLVLSIGARGDMVATLERDLLSVDRQVGGTALVLGFDCILRCLEAERAGLLGEVSKTMAEHGVIGFASYGEQLDGVHINQSFTGVAIGGGSHQVGHQ